MVTKRALEIPEKKAKLKLVGEDGNAFSIIGRAAQAMRKAGYSKELIEQYQHEAMEGDYGNLLRVTMEYTEVKL